MSKLTQSDVKCYFMRELTLRQDLMSRLDSMKLRFWPDSALKTACNRVEDFSTIPEVVEGMAEVMYSNGGMGLAANQVGLDHELFLMDREGLLVFVNPRVRRLFGGIERQLEGCLSFPGVQEYIERPEGVEVAAQDQHGNPFTLTLRGYEARCVLHELEHLVGGSWLDAMSALQRKTVLKQLSQSRR